MTDAAPVLAVFDVDGVVADVRHRLHHVNRKPKNWAGFFAAAGRDTPLGDGIALAVEYARTHRIVWLTGRPERLREVTMRWLTAQRLPVDCLVMRPSYDRRPARIFKIEQLARLATQHTVGVVVDDDPDVVALLRQQGWPVHLADWVPYAEAQRQAQERDGRT